MRQKSIEKLVIRHHFDSTYCSCKSQQSAKQRPQSVDGLVEHWVCMIPQEHALPTAQQRMHMWHGKHAKRRQLCGQLEDLNSSFTCTSLQVKCMLRCAVLYSDISQGEAAASIVFATGTNACTPFVPRPEGLTPIDPCV